MERVLVLGCAGSGKSTLARRISEQHGLPLIELDRAYWRPGWVAVTDDEWLALMREFSARPRWIMDGNYTRTLPLRLARADTVIWLDHPRHVCLRRVLMRTAKGYGRVREGLPEGCPERFDMEFLRYVWNYPARNRPRVAAVLKEFGAHARVHIMKGDQDVERLLIELRINGAEPLTASPRQPPIQRSELPSCD